MIDRYKKALFSLCIFLCCLPIVTGPIALIMGFGLRNIPGTFNIDVRPDLTKRLLQLAVIALGLCIDVQAVAATGLNSFVLITLSVLTVLSLGFLFARWLRLEKNLSWLISSGTAICGGSAIASVAPVMNASGKDITMSMAVIFVLNALAIFAFPAIGLALDMTETQFGLWCAVAIHDTSSVVGAAAVYGEQALELAATAKLARVLWIIPVMLLLSLINKSSGKLKFPWFILLFLLAMGLTGLYPLSEAVTAGIFQFSKALLAIVLFLMGSTLSLTQLKNIGHKPLLFGTTLWICIAAISGLAILKFF